MFRILAILASSLCLPLIAFGALVRLKGAGLSCPDWPLCYGTSLSPETYGTIIGMTHRSFGLILGCVVLGLVILSYKRLELTSYRKITLIALALVGMQATTGILSIQFNLAPIFVMLHLLGSFILFGVLIFITYYAHRGRINNGVFESGDTAILTPNSKIRLRMILIYTVMVLSGAYTSSTYSGFTCDGFPSCSNESPHSWVQIQADNGSFQAVIPKELNADFFLNHQNALIQMLHRTLATAGGLILMWMIFRVLIFHPPIPSDRPLGWLVIALLCTQILVGISNSIFHVPIPVSTLHTFLAGSIAGLLSLIFAKSTYDL